MNNLRFYKFRNNKDSINYKCIDKMCSASLTIKNEIIVRFVEHTKEHIPLSKVDVDMRGFRADLKETILKQPIQMPIQQLYELKLAEYTKNSGCTQEEIDKGVVPFQSIKSGLFKIRSKALPKLPTSIKEIVITDEYQIITRSANSEVDIEKNVSVAQVR